MKKIIEKIIEITIKFSGFITSFLILLIIIYLFNQSIGIFQQKEVENGYVLIVNKSNKIDKLSSFEIKEIFDQNITNWNEIDNDLKDENTKANELKNNELSEIQLFDINQIESYFSAEELGENYENIPNCLNKFIGENQNILAFVPENYINEIAKSSSFQGKILESQNIKFSNLIKGTEWYPTAVPAQQFGLLPLFLGTFWVSIGAILIAFPLGLIVAIYLSEFSSARFRSIFKPVIELLAGIPSVVYGFFGLVILVPFIQKTFNLPVGETALTGSLILSIMILPTIISIAEDSLQTIPKAIKEASLALGATEFQTIFRVLIPYAKSGIITSGVLGIGRAIGETMAVLMVTGNAAVIPHSFLEPVRTIPATIAAELGETASGSSHFQILFLLGASLFIITFLFNLLVEYISASKTKSKKSRIFLFKRS
jgi:phosphate transport system permease protein